MVESKRRFTHAKDILKSKEFLDQRVKSAKYISQEFQDYGYRLAVHLNDLEHKSLYIKLAKTVDRNLLAIALGFAKDYPNAKNKGKIFMWKLKEIRSASKADKKMKKRLNAKNEEGQEKLNL